MTPLLQFFISHPAFLRIIFDNNLFHLRTLNDRYRQNKLRFLVTRANIIRSLITRFFLWLNIDDEAPAARYKHKLEDLSVSEMWIEMLNVTGENLTANTLGASDEIDCKCPESWRLRYA